MTRHPLVLLLVALAVCVAVGWGMPLAMDALKRSLSPGGLPEQAEGAEQPAQGKAPGEGTTGAVPTAPDIPTN